VWACPGCYVSSQGTHEAVSTTELGCQRGAPGTLKLILKEVYEGGHQQHEGGNASNACVEHEEQEELRCMASEWEQNSPLFCKHG